MTSYARRQLLAVRAPRDTVKGRRIRSLFRSFIAKLEADDPSHQAAALAAAELMVAAEAGRANLIQASATTKELEESVTRLENTARRAREDLAVLAKAVKANDGPDWVELQEEAARQIQEEDAQRREGQS